MQDPQTNTADETKKKKGKGKTIVIIVLLVVLLGGAGGGFYFWRSSVAASAKNKKASAAPEEKSTGEKTTGESSDSDVKKIIELPPFIVNLADTEDARYLRMTVSLGVGGDEISEKPDQIFTTKVRNAMLAVLTNKRSDEVLSAEGKTKLRKELLKAAQDASEEPQVKAVYITDLIVQL